MRIPMRNKSFGEEYELSFVDHLGIWLSNRKALKIIKNCKEKPIVLDIGCGFHAYLLNSYANLFKKGYGIDISVTNKQINQNITLINGPIESSIAGFSEGSINIILMISVLEHLSDPLQVLNQCYYVLNQEGQLLINIPTWRGKKILEFLAFSLKLSPKEEMNDHKMYYDIRDIWPLLVKSGFKPSEISLHYYKLGLNLFCICKKN